MKIEFLTIIFFLILISFLLVAVLALGFYFIFNKKTLEKDKLQQEGEMVVSEPEISLDTMTNDPPIENCIIHDDVQAQAFCAICKIPLCENCTREDDKTYFCAEHFKLYLRYNWTQVESVITTPDCPEKGIYIYNFQEKIWEVDKTPSFIVTHYKINVETDHIESEVILMGRDSDKDFLQQKIKAPKEEPLN